MSEFISNLGTMPLMALCFVGVSVYGVYHLTRHLTRSVKNETTVTIKPACSELAKVTHDSSESEESSAPIGLQGTSGPRASVPISTTSGSTGPKQRSRGQAKTDPADTLPRRRKRRHRQPRREKRERRERNNVPLRAENPFRSDLLQMRGVKET